MLKRARPVSPVSGGSSYDDDEERPRTKRVRFATGINGDASSSWADRDRNARQEREPEEEQMAEEPIWRGRRVVKGGSRREPEFDEDGGGDASDEEGGSSSDEETPAPTQRYSRSPPPPERIAPTTTKSTWSEYTTINSLLGALNRSRTSNHKFIAPVTTLTPPQSRRLPTSGGVEGSSEVVRRGAAAPKSKTVPVPIAAPSIAGRQGQPSLGVLGWRHSRATAHRHRPAVSSPLSQAAISNENHENDAAESAVKWESELVRQRYEETNRLLKSLILSRRPAPEDPEDEEE